MTDIPEDIMADAERTLDNMLNECTESCGGKEGLRADAIGKIARALMAERERSDEKSRRLSKAFEDMIMMVDFEKCKITIAFETAAETEEAQQALSESIGWEKIGEMAW